MASPKTSGPASVRSCTTATLRCGEENSRARIFISNAPFRFTAHFNPDQAKGVSGTGNSMETLGFGLRTLDFPKPPFGPFDHGHPRRLQIFLEAGGQDLLTSVQPIRSEERREGKEGRSR